MSLHPVRRLLLLPVVGLFCVSAPSHAQSVVTDPVGFQGRLNNPDGTPVADTASQSFTFRLFDAATAGNELWEQTSANVSVTKGLFAVPLGFSTGYIGTHTQAGVFSGSPIFLEVQAGTDPPMTPRQQLAGSPFAFMSKTALSVPDASITDAKIVSLTYGKITGAPTSLPPSGAATGDLTGTYPNPTIGAGKVTAAKIAAGVIPSTLPPSGAASGDLSGTYPGPTIATGAVTAAKIATGVIPATLPPTGSAAGDLSGTYPNPTIAAGAVTAAKIAAGVIPTALPPTGAAGGDLGGSYPNPSLTGSLRAPLTLLSRADPTFLGSVATGTLPQAVAVANGYAYVVNKTSGTLQIFDISTPASPVLKGSVAIAPNPTCVVVAGSYAYVGGTGLQTINVSNPAAPVLTGTSNLGTYINLTVVGTMLYAVDGSSLSTYSISNPTAPGRLDAQNVGTNLAQGVAVSGSYAYLIGGSSTGKLQVWNISTPANLPSTATSSLSLGFRPKSVTLLGNTAFIADEEGFYSANVTDPAHPQLLDTVLPTSPQTGTSLAIANGFAYVNGDGELQVYDVRNPAAVTPWSSVRIDDTVTSVAVSGEVLCSTFASTNLLRAGTTNALVAADNLRVRAGGSFAGTVTVNGDINDFGSVRANGVVLTSDARFKQGIAPIKDALDSLLNLRGVSYEWRRDEFKQHGFTEGRQLGFIAQELETTFPELVTTGSDGYKGVNYTGILPVAVEAIKTLNAKVDAQAKANAELRAKNAALEARLTRLEKTVNGRK